MNKTCITLLLCLKDASVRNQQMITISLSKVNIALLIKFYNEGLIQGFNILKNHLKSQYKILVFLRYFFTKSIFKSIKFLSKPSLYFYLKFLDICILLDKRHTLFFATSKGILTNLECKKFRVGGIALFKC